LISLKKKGWRMCEPNLQERGGPRAGPYGGGRGEEKIYGVKSQKSNLAGKNLQGLRGKETRRDHHL